MQGYRSRRTLCRDINVIAIDEVKHDEVVVYNIRRVKPRQTGDIRIAL